MSKITNNVTVKEFIKYWLEKHGGTLSMNTLGGYKSKVDNYILPRIGEYEIVRLRRSHVKNLLIDIQENGRVRGEKPLKANTVRQTYRILSKCLSLAVDLELIEENPCRDITIKSGEKYNYQWLDEAEEIDEYIAAFADTDMFLPVIRENKINIDKKIMSFL